MIRRAGCVFLGISINFPAEARREAGFELNAVQQGFDPPDWKPMSDIGLGVREIRIHSLGEWRTSPVPFRQGRWESQACDLERNLDWRQFQ